MKKKIKAVIFDGKTLPKVVEVDNDLDGFYKALECDSLEGYTATELGRLYGLDIYMDEYGKLRENKHLLTGLFVRQDTQEIVDTLIGNLLICMHDDEGESISAPPFGDTLVAKHVRLRIETNIPKVWEDKFGSFEVAPYLLILSC